MCDVLGTTVASSPQLYYPQIKTLITYLLKKGTLDMFKSLELTEDAPGFDMDYNMHPWKNRRGFHVFEIVFGPCSEIVVYV